MSARGSALRVREVSALRTLCLRLPHAVTPLERRQLARFDSLVAAPSTATAADVDAIATGWTAWWRRGEATRIHEMSKSIASPIVDEHRSLATLSVAARLLSWHRVQHTIWRCAACAGHARVQTDLRQQTESPVREHTRLMVISLAPPFVPVRGRTVAASATNDPADRLRLFVEQTLGRSWEQLAWAGLTLAHAAKCAIVPTAEGYQNPPGDVIARCAPQHLKAELTLAAPAFVVTLGNRAYEALVRAVPTATTTQGVLRLSHPPAHGTEVIADGIRLRLFVAPFIRPPNRRRAAEVLQEAAAAAGL